MLALSTAQAQTGSVGIGTIAPDGSAALDVRSTDKGLLIPRVALASLTDATTVASPAPSLLVCNTTAALGVGYYYNAGTARVPQWQRLATQASLDATNATVADLGTTSWRTTGNALTATSRLGTTTNQSVDLLTNNAVRGRMSNSGEFFWGATSTAQSGDLMNAVSNSSFPFALNGYSSNNGSGVYGAIQGTNTTTYAAVQGENNSNSGGANTAGVRGVNRSYNAGTGFRALLGTGPRAGVVGAIAQPGAYAFGVHGTSPSYTKRTGAVFGDDGGLCYGAMAYYSADNHDYSFYGFGNPDNITTGSGTGLQAGPAAPVVNTHIGLGIDGGVLGGWVRGQAYGLLARGERYNLYVDGAAVTNQPLTQLVARASGERVAAYAPVAQLGPGPGRAARRTGSGGASGGLWGAAGQPPGSHHHRDAHRRHPGRVRGRSHRKRFRGARKPGRPQLGRLALDRERPAPRRPRREAGARTAGPRLRRPAAGPDAQRRCPYRVRPPFLVGWPAGALRRPTPQAATRGAHARPAGAGSRCRPVVTKPTKKPWQLAGTFSWACVP
ncbi:hypothetical protein [Hymenobacter ruricola]|uniref:Peptidase S74 domain-containing protein n=1 Tax=Hymenobacter ruricola TaxID=2791023 RepID=A0ABS0IA00_9BACT|nr:hypothetical protein [Hymenobacter ruricola]MBF9223796.1 hypothetical protein [Hymenobacter ruricola]